jgi:hypothetical protein
MGSVLHLIPKMPKKDFNKLFKNSGKILRFTARFVDPKPEDRDRLFVFNFFLQDDCLSIHEPPQRNLGIVTGRFVEKAVHMNQMTGKLFQPEDFVPGNVVSIYNHKFEILDMDEYTRKTIADPEERHMNMDLSVVVEKIRESMRQQFPLVRDIFRRFDTDHDGVITAEEFGRALHKFGYMLDERETLVIMKYFDKRGDGQVTYNEFCDALLDEDYTQSMLKTKNSLDTEFDPEYAQRAKVKSLERAETEKVRKAMRQIGDSLYKFPGVIHRMTKELQHLTHLPVVTSEQMQYAFKQIGHSFQLEDVQRAVLYIYPHGDLNEIPYKDFFQAVVSSFHDLSAPR